jgi:hypothetical protein
VLCDLQFPLANISSRAKLSIQFLDATAERILPGVAAILASFNKDFIYPAITVREAGFSGPLKVMNKFDDPLCIRLSLSILIDFFIQ